MPSASRRISPAEYVFVLLSASLCLTISYTVSHLRPMWSDELFSWMLVTDPSFHHMISSWRAGADGGGIAFYLLLRGWLDVFGRSLVALRFFSAVGVFFGLFFVWLSARRYYDRLPLAVGLGFIWFSGDAILWHLVQTRFYGLLLGGTALVFYLGVRVSREDSVGKSLLAMLFASHLLLVATHPFGSVYSAVLILSLMLVDRSYRRFRPSVYLAAGSGWIVLIPCQEAIRNTAAVGKPHFWTVRPHLHELIHVYMLNNKHIGKLLIATMLLACGTLLLHGSTSLRASLLARRAVLIPSLLLGLVPAAVWVISQRGTSLFVDRYLLPLGIALAILSTELLQRIWEAHVAGWWRYPLRFIQGSIVAILAASAGRDALRYTHTIDLPPKDFTLNLLALLPRGEPVVFERADIFDVMISERGRDGIPFVYLLDWDVAMATDSPPGDVSGFHELENWRKVGYYSGSIIDAPAFLRTTDHFAVVDDADEKWFQHRINGSPDWRTREIGVFGPAEGQTKIWQVDRRSARP